MVQKRKILKWPSKRIWTSAIFYQNEETAHYPCSTFLKIFIVKPWQSKFHLRFKFKVIGQSRRSSEINWLKSIGGWRVAFNNKIKVWRRSWKFFTTKTAWRRILWIYAMCRSGFPELTVNKQSELRQSVESFQRFWSMELQSNSSWRKRQRRWNGRCAFEQKWQAVGS